MTARTTELNEQFLSDLIALGEGYTTEFKRIREMCRDYGVAEPVIDVSEHWVTTTFKRPSEQVRDQVTGEVTGEVQRLLRVLAGDPLNRVQAQGALALKSDANFRDRYLVPALERGFIEMTIPDKPNSRLQKYRLTPEGRAVLEAADGGPP